MIFKRDWVDDLLRTGEAMDCRPIYRRNGQAMAYKVGGVYPVQPGRFAPHVCHVRVTAMEPASVGELRQRDDEEWALPVGWADDLGVQVMQLKLEARQACCAPFFP